MPPAYIMWCFLLQLARLHQATRSRPPQSEPSGTGSRFRRLPHCAEGVAEGVLVSLVTNYMDSIQGRLTCRATLMLSKNAIQATREALRTSWLRRYWESWADVAEGSKLLGGAAGHVWAPPLAFAHWRRLCG